MDVQTAIRTRRSCRSFSPEPIPDEDLRAIVEAGTWAPSPANNQPWEFIAITNTDVRQKLHDHAEALKATMLEKSGWKWLGKYSVGFITQAPVIVAVIADPAKNGADRFIDGGGFGYRDACAACIQNMLLAAHDLGYSGLWFTLFEPVTVSGILGSDPAKQPLALLCLGKPSGPPTPTPRKSGLDLTTYLK